MDLDDWLKKTSENVKINNKFCNGVTDQEIDQAIIKSFNYNDDDSEFKLKKHYDIYEFPTNGQQNFMFGLIQTILKMEQRISELENK